MNSKKYIAGMAVAGAIACLASVVPAFADTNANVGVNLNTSVKADWDGGRMPHPGQGQNGDDKKLPRMMEGEKPIFVGKVTAVSGTTLTVSGRSPGQNASTTFTVNALNAVVMKGGATSTLASIAVGDNVVIQGTLSGTTVTATKIRDGMIRPGNGANMPQGNGEPVVLGTVSSVSGTTLTITNNGSATYTVNATNAKIAVKGNASATVSNISVGDQVVVQGAVNGTSITASSVIDRGAKPADDGNKGNGNDNKQSIGFFGKIGSFFKHLFGF